MREVYRKEGRIARWENGTLVLVSESGIAIEEGELFECMPEPHGETLAEPEDDLPAVAAAIAALMPDGVGIERLLLTSGRAVHDTNGVRWSDETRRLHLSMTRGRMRALLDLGDFSSHERIGAIAGMLARAEEQEREPPPRLRLAANVTAALLRLLPLLGGSAPCGVQLRQRAGALDGRGARVEDVAIERPPYPNWYRPSYRVRPTRAPIDLYATCGERAIEAQLPVAVALLAVPHGPPRLRVLLQDGARVYPAAVGVRRITALAPAEAWHPYGAGVWAGEAVVERGG